MKILSVMALAGLTALPLLGCQALVKPQTEHDAAIASGIGNAFEFRMDELPDQEPATLAAVLTLKDAVDRAPDLTPPFRRPSRGCVWRKRNRNRFGCCRIR